MKTTITINHLLFAILTTAFLGGCATAPQNPIYKKWEQAAYSTYGVATPQGGESVVPALFRTVNSSRYQTPQIAKAAARSTAPAPQQNSATQAPASSTQQAPRGNQNLQARPWLNGRFQKTENRYIEHHYGL